MNEYFGELSRPMRNRGIEIYLNEFNPIENMTRDDERIILKSLYSFGEKEFNYFFDQIVLSSDLGNDLIKKLNFVQLLKIFKMVYDFWLAENSTECETKTGADCLRNALTEMKMENFYDRISMNQSIQSIKTKQFYSNSVKLKELPIFRHLYNFPLFSQLITQFKKQFSSLTELTLKNYSDYFISSMKTTQLVETWLKLISIGSINNVLKFAYSRFSRQSVNNRYKEAVEILFQSVVEPLFDIEKNVNFASFYNLLKSIGTSVGLDLNDECLELGSNSFLVQKLGKKLNNQELLVSLFKLSSVLQLEIMFNLSKYRLSVFYTIQHDSVIALSQNSLDKKMSVFKFVTMFNELYETFIRDIMSAVSESKVQDYEMFIRLVKSCVYLFEKFFLVTATKYDSHLSCSYMKYYWSFLHENLKNIHNLCSK